jgi:hypothetical protein
VKEALLQPELKGFDCFDFDPIDQWVPSDPVDVCYPLCLHIGTAGQEGADLFYVQVTTPKVMHRNPGPPRHQLVVNPYSWAKVLGQVDDILQRTRGATWEECARQLCQFFRWEFEGIDKMS